MSLIIKLKVYQMYDYNRHECTASKCKYDPDVEGNWDKCTDNCVWATSQLKAEHILEGYKKLQEAIHVTEQT